MNASLEELGSMFPARWGGGLVREGVREDSWIVPMLPFCSNLAGFISHFPLIAVSRALYIGHRGQGSGCRVR